MDSSDSDNSRPESILLRVTDDEDVRIRRPKKKPRAKVLRATTAEILRYLWFVESRVRYVHAPLPGKYLKQDRMPYILEFQKALVEELSAHFSDRWRDIGLLTLNSMLGVWISDLRHALAGSAMNIHYLEFLKVQDELDFIQQGDIHFCRHHTYKCVYK